MLKYIAQRGNIIGSDPYNENSIDYLYNAFNLGYGVEIDVLLYKGKLYLGHDEPKTIVPVELLHKPDVFVHAKNLSALEALIKLNCNVFWHQNDSVTITNYGYIWCYPGVHVNLLKAVWLDLHDKPLPEKIDNIYGICGDVYKEKYF